MVDHYQTVCAMCGDVGFPEKLFRCSKCHRRFQHSYCSNYYYYSEQSDPVQVCDWCQSEQRSWKHGGGGGGPSRRLTGRSDSGTNRSQYSGDKIKQHDREEGMEKSPGKNPAGGAASSLPRTPTRRYKLLKDVMC
ncbi:PREDICTED: uncharacterized protein LOC109157631 [Ipomoea nil]|uniref:uncharacterized protein LOC109157631 n=1 Tax=Ipomoea nil TaxID=35883 RepID=UPI0009012CAD|nr:PREDICTED: uncharacterized protein LOC109157631 [Ipomoea nil]